MRTRSVLLAGCCLAAVGLSVPAHAQQAVQQDAEAHAVQDVIVTAQRRAQRLEEVPIAITAVSKQTLESAAIRGLDEIAARAPSFTMTAMNVAQPRLYIRGAGSNEDGAAQDGSVAVFVDDVYVARGAGQAFEFLDIERIEVLRGPQGTLYGKNVVGGLINVISSRPGYQLDAAADLTVGNYGALEGRGYVTGGLSDKLAASVAVVSRQRDGYARNIRLNRDLEDLDLFAIRGQLRYQPNEDLDLLLSADYSTHSDNGTSRRGEGPFGATPFGSVTLVQTSDNPRESESPRVTYQDRDIFGLTGRAEWNVGPGQLTSITAWRTSDVSLGDAFTGMASPPYAPLDTLNMEDETAEQFSQEVRYAFSGLFDDRLTGVVGAYFLHENVDRTETADLISYIGSRVPALGGLTGVSASYQEATTQSLGVFASGTWKFTDKLSTTVGVRYTSETKDVHTAVVSLEDTDAIIAAPPTEEYDIRADGKWDGVTPRISVEYQPLEHLNLYASYSQGFKSGGFQGQAPTGAAASSPFDPENAESFEIGAKGRLFGNRLSYAISAFSTEYTDLQVRQNSQRPTDPLPVLRITNAGSAEAKGFEVEFNARPANWLDVWGSYSNLSAKYTDLVDNNGVDRAGYRMSYAPASSYNVGAEGRWDVTGGFEAYARAEYRWQDTFYYDVDNSRANTQEAYGLLSASIGVRTGDNRWGVELWGKNLTDELYTINSIPFLGDRFVLYGAPKTYGLRLRWNY
ncbi:MAG: TonB-dependent receptor [Bordetella sp.]|nr:TonB-dependent receptor [Bordetella sp.]